MKKKEMKKLINGEINTDNTTFDGIFAAVYAMEPTQPVGPLITMIRKIRKEKGLVASTNISALASAREELAGREEMPSTYKGMRELAESLQDKFEISDDTDKGVASAMKAIAARMKELELPVPKKIHIGETKALTIEYFAEAEDNGDDTSRDDLAEYLIANVEGAGEDATDDVKEKLNVTAGTFYNFAYLLWNHLTVDELN